MEERLVAQVAVSAATYAIDRPYSYLIPPALEEQVRPGMRVLAAFGRGNRRTEGLILSLKRQEPPPRLKAVHALLDQEPVVSGEELRLALWMRDRYFCTVYEAVKAMLPAGLYFSLKDSYMLAPGVDRERAYQAAGGQESARRVLDVVFARNGSAEAVQIQDAFGEKNPRPALKALLEQGILTMETSVSRGVGDKTEQTARLAMPAEEAVKLLSASRGRKPLWYSVVEMLSSMGAVSAREVCYFTGASQATLRTLAKKGVLELEQKLAREIITSYEDVRVTVDEAAPTVCLVEFSFTVAHGLNQIHLTAHITV